MQKAQHVQLKALIESNEELSKMQKGQRKQLEVLIKDNEELSKLLRVGQVFSELITREDYEELAAGRRCIKWGQAPSGKWICLLWEG
jgi:hypothetical protein